MFHPGDALTGPGEAVDLLLLPVSAPWLKVSEAIDFAREVGAPHNLAIHDRVYSEPGWGSSTATSTGSCRRQASATSAPPMGPT